MTGKNIVVDVVTRVLSIEILFIDLLVFHVFTIIRENLFLQKFLGNEITFVYSREFFFNAKFAKS